MRLFGFRVWRDAARRLPYVSAWPIVLVILTQMAVGGFSVYTLSSIRAYVTNEGIWAKGEDEAVYSLTLYLDTGNTRDLADFKRAVAVPIAYRSARNELEATDADLSQVRALLHQAGTSRDDIPCLIWMFRHFRGFPYLEESIARWKETDTVITELQQFGDLAEKATTGDARAALRSRIRQIDDDVTPRAEAFNRALNDGAHVVERLLLLANLGFAVALAALTIWRVGKARTHRQKFEAELAWQATHDTLTGLPNRRAFEDRLADLARTSSVAPQESVAILFIDLDQFKIVNDTCGHAAGDALLLQICIPIRSALRPGDLLVRFGGDEFSIILSDIAADDAISMAETIRTAVEKTKFFWESKVFSVTASVGIVYDVLTDSNVEAMLSHADMACFMAKEKGRNRVHFHCSKDQEVIGRMREMTWVQRIHDAVTDGRFQLFAQEIVPLAGIDDGIRLELLVRMLDESGALISPASFLPAAERFGLMRLIDRWVVDAAFRTLEERAALARFAPITSCGINLSGATIGDEAFLEFLKAKIATCRIDPRMICFEVTETSAIQNLHAALAFVSDLQKLGCSFALDDFGSGMSSFSYLKELPVDYLKIDGKFVANILTERADRAMVEMVGHVGHIMGKRIVAEFVESERLADALREIGIDYGQGHALAKPKPFRADFQPTAVRERSSYTALERLRA